MNPPRGGNNNGPDQAANGEDEDAFVQVMERAANGGEGHGGAAGGAAGGAPAHHGLEQNENNNNALPPPPPPAQQIDRVDLDHNQDVENGDNGGVADDGDDDGNNNLDGIIDAGVAVGPDGDGNKRQSDCDLVLLIECIENLHILAPDNPILRRGVTVSIGLDKNTKLQAVFARYCEFINDYPTPPSSRRGGDRSTDRTDVRPSDLEFLHCTLLSPGDTTESSALMKDDKIKVRRVRAEEREAAAERNRLQRESDREYFKRLRLLLPDLIGTNCDVMLDCRGKLVDENGLNQEVLRTGVRAHSALVGKRCKWLGRIIKCAREDVEKKTVMAIPDGDGNIGGFAPRGKGGLARTVSTGGSRGAPSVAAVAVDGSESVQRRADDDDEDEIEVLPYPRTAGENNNPVGAAQQGGVNNAINERPHAAEIENDEDESGSGPAAMRTVSVELSSVPRRADAQDLRETNGASSPVLSSASGSNSMLWVTLPHHPPEAVKLLLEYCYTNRVIPLGQEAFAQASKKVTDGAGGSYQQHMTGPVAPYHNISQGHRGWPNNGLPTVSLSVALAGIALAEEASMPRLSLMCEVAASQLVTSQSVLEALAMCTTQQKNTGNKLHVLRKAAMEFVLGNGRRGVQELCRTTTFRRNLEEKRNLVVPSLLMGTTEILPQQVGGSSSGVYHGGSGSRKRDTGEMTRHYFETLDQEDSFSREMERKKRRSERWKARGGTTIGDDGAVIGLEEDNEKILALDSFGSLVSSDTTKFSLKRMANHQLGAGCPFAIGRSEANASGGRGDYFGSHGYALIGGRVRGSGGGRSTSRNRRRGERASGAK